MRYYAQAYGGDGGQILGNLDGQMVWNGPGYARSNHYKSLITGKSRPRWGRVQCWKIVAENGRECGMIYNPFYQPKARPVP